MNDPPTEVVLNSTGVPENSPAGTIIGPLSTKDEDLGQTHTYQVLEIANVSDASELDERTRVAAVLYFLC